MTLMLWNDRLAVHITEIDTQHKKLVSLLNDLHEAMSQGKGNEVALKVLNELVEYTRNHFATEEKLFAKTNYPGTVRHKAEHKELTRQVLDFQQQFKAGKAGLTIQLMTFLKDWLTNHILNSDHAYAPYLIGKGVE